MSLRFRRWFRELCTFIKIKSSVKPQYPLNLIRKGQHSYNIQSLDRVETHCRTDALKKFFFPYTIAERNKPDLDIRKFNHNPMRLKLLTRLRVGLSHLKEQI